MKFRFHVVDDHPPHTEISLHVGDYPGAYCGSITMRTDEWAAFQHVLAKAGVINVRNALEVDSNG
jgi:hypothetical protein